MSRDTDPRPSPVEVTFRVVSDLRPDEPRPGEIVTGGEGLVRARPGRHVTGRRAPHPLFFCPCGEGRDVCQGDVVGEPPCRYDRVGRERTA